jgi:thioredoxin reductase
MSRDEVSVDFDVAVIGGGPPGLSAAVVLGRACRRVVLFDHGKPRNMAAQAVHCYLGHDGITPARLRELGRREAQAYGVQFRDQEVVAARRLAGIDPQRDGFEVKTTNETFVVRTLLLATGLVDVLPDIANVREFYGRSVHHCPYCDGWEHRDQQLAAFGDGDKAAALALSLRTWSHQVTACLNGHELSVSSRRELEQHDIAIRSETVRSLEGSAGLLEEVCFESGPPLRCDALFFSAGKFQRSPLATMLGCECDQEGMVRTSDKQSTGINGLFLAGDADGEVQFAIVAAAEGATAATAINKLLQQDEHERR